MIARAFLLLLCLVAPAGAALFDEASALYDRQQFSEARDRYEQLLGQGERTANVFYNLGNSEFRLGHGGRAILSYERALLLEPRHPEALANLALVRSQAGAKSLPAHTIDALLLPLPAMTYGIVAAAAFWVAIFALAGLFLWRGLRGLLSAALAGGVLIAVYAGAALWRDAAHREIAVVTTAEVTARLEAADRAGVAETLPAGSDVRLLSEHGAWTYCELPGGGRGWLLSKSIERLAPAAL